MSDEVTEELKNQIVEFFKQKGKMMTHRDVANGLQASQQQIIEAAWRILDQGDAYSGDLAASEADLRPLLKPAFCPDAELSWYDPIAFLRTWRRRTALMTTKRAAMAATVTRPHQI